MRIRSQRDRLSTQPYAEATADLETYRRGLPASFHSDTGRPLDVAATWQRLVTQPLPEASTQPIPG